LRALGWKDINWNSQSIHVQRSFRNGESPVYVKEQLGHSSIQMTVDNYGHLIPTSNREAVNRLDNYPFPRFVAKLNAEIIINIPPFTKEAYSEFPPLFANSPIFPTKDCQFHQAGW